MYSIIGGDGKQYGPISDAELRKWISEGRLNADSLAKGESDSEFRPLSAFPEFAALLGIAPPTLGTAPVLGARVEDRELVAQKVKVPAIGLIISASISIVMSLWGLIRLGSVREQLQQMDAQLQQLNNPQLQQFIDTVAHFFSGPFGIINQIFQLIISILILTGAIKMLNLRSYQFAFAAAILSVLPCITPCCGWLLGLIFGIWSMVVLGKADVKSRFE
ncbi:MAG TPA: DUF4339 domain-containing protein [Candidatus Acidoferrales bacterium]|jgi:hypothetical protein|nr:DUF4339 domain-containing protein [Candidatus Acidoferrales bacterium]